MWLLNFYRFYLSLAAGAFVFFFGERKIWPALATVIAFRTAWFFIEGRVRHNQIERSFRKHAPAFKQALGPYGIRLINKAEDDPRTKQSLAEVFTPNMRALRRTVEQLEMLNTLFNAGMRPTGDEFLLHDCKLKYGRMRLQETKMTAKKSD
ncbi:MAG: hypothetical protein GF344_16185 [Chitinivibrionales bacterium]|nr:hypothetical protein [Chitinivibrionales bacterium]MBD3358231.1 hypothetical protein [Chitinivibrionales bacterium]